MKPRQCSDWIAYRDRQRNDSGLKMVFVAGLVFFVFVYITELGGLNIDVLDSAGSQVSHVESLAEKMLALEMKGNRE